MATIREIRRRIRSVKNTAKITKAMELVAASRMRRAQEMVLASRPYASLMRELIGNLAIQTARDSESVHPLLARREEGPMGLLLITSDRGLCGGFNANILRRAVLFMLEKREPTGIIAVGRKGRDFAVRSGYDLRAEFTGLGDQPSFLNTLPISRGIIDDYTNGVFKEVWLVYSDFVSTTIQRPSARRLLPVETSLTARETGLAEARIRNFSGYLYEPDPLSVLGVLLPRYVEVQVYQAILESIASEHSARMVAMRNATDNANELVDSLTLTLNAVRQAGITRELIDIATSARALAEQR